MPVIARGQRSDGNSPVLDLFTATGGMLADVATLAFQIFDISDDTKRGNPVQVFPQTAGDRATVNTTVLWPAGDKLGTGHYVAQWTPPSDAALGRYEIRWYLQMTNGAPEQTVREEFDVLLEGAISSPSGYALVSDLRDEGVTVTQGTDARIARLILLASQYVDRVTSRFFEPRPMTLSMNGSGGRSQLLGHPIVAVNQVQMFVGTFTELSTTPVDPTIYRVYNRHLTQGLLDPDDRDDPKIEFIHWSDLLGVHATAGGYLGLGSLVWLSGVQNVIVDGLFGYTDPDGTPVGRTPDLIRHVTKLLVMRELPQMTDLARREERQQRWRLTSEHTRDQGYNLGSLQLTGPYTGDPEIDNILVTYQRLPQLGGV